MGSAPHGQRNASPNASLRRSNGGHHGEPTAIEDACSTAASLQSRPRRHASTDKLLDDAATAARAAPAPDPSKQQKGKLFASDDPDSDVFDSGPLAGKTGGEAEEAVAQVEVEPTLSASARLD
eukprot:285963-Prymnesium_polylepis.2